MKRLCGTMLVMLAAASCSGGDQDQPLAWLRFTRFDKKAALQNGFYMYYTAGVDRIEIEMDVPPHPTHKLAFMWICRQGPVRSMKINVNGKSKVVTKPAMGNGRQSFFWDVIGVSEFGINREGQGKYRLLITCPEDALEDGLLGGVRLITDEKQLKELGLVEDSKTTLIYPGSRDKPTPEAVRAQRQAMKERVFRKWVAKEKLSEAEIRRDKFLSAAVKFADTVIGHGRDVYGPEHTPLFADYLHTDTLKSPHNGGIFLNAAHGGPGYPIVRMNFHRHQNLLRLLAELSLITGDEKYVEAAMEEVAFMFDRYWLPESGLLVFGNHRVIDLESGRAFAAERPGAILEISAVFPFYDFWYDVDPEKTSSFVKGLWEAYTSDWHTMNYNRHASFDKHPDFTKTWDRPFTSVKDLPERISGLSFMKVALDLSYSGYMIGFLEKNDKPIKWANRRLRIFDYKRDPKTRIWPILVYGDRSDRGLSAYGKAFPKSNPMEARCVVGGYVTSQSRYFLAALGMMEQAKKYGRYKGQESIHKSIDEWILGYMKAAYDPENHRLRHIIIDGTDVTDFVSPEGGLGLSKGASFLPVKVISYFHAAVARGLRLTEDATRRREYWELLRHLFKGDDLGDIGRCEDDRPAFNLGTRTAEPAFVYALVDLYRVTKRKEYLTFMEHIGNNIIELRQEPSSGLFRLEADRWMFLQIVDDPQSRSMSGMTVKEFMRKKVGKYHKLYYPLDYDQPKGVATDVFEPHALLAIWACRTVRLDNIPFWIAGAQYGLGASSGHIVDKTLDIWWDREKLQETYEADPDYFFRKKQAVIDERWYPRD